MKILIVEDEYNLADVLSESLKKEGYNVDIQTDGEDGYLSILSNIYDLVILDVMLPNMSGFEILSRIKREKINSKVIMLTVKSTLDDKLLGLKNGANDYITKPFHIEEVIARVNIQLKNCNNLDVLKYKDLELNLSNYNLKCLKTGANVELVCKEFNLLEYFINNNEQVLSKDQIYSKIWGLDNECQSNNLEVYLSFLRKKIKAIGSNVNIKSIRNIGYRLEYKND